MEKFQKTTLFVASVILIISLIILGFIIRNTLANQEFPPIKNECPDYWDVSHNITTGKLNCVNRLKNNNVNNCTNNNDTECNNFYTINWETRAGSQIEEDIVCAKYQWAKQKGLSWDGITNNSKACKI